MDEIPRSPSSNLQALERFVVDNDDLLQLEEHIGRFNIFDALGVARAEIKHSNFLGWLLDPAKSHGQGALFLRALVMDLLRQSPPELRVFSPVELDGADLRGVEVRREWRHVDLLITCREPCFVIAIENKVDSSESGHQLLRYEKVLQDHFPDHPVQFVYLTVGGDEPSREAWVSYTYEDIHRVLGRVLRLNADSIGEDVRTFCDHYLRLLGSRFMEDPKIDELCQRIYKNHRQALDLIYERTVPPGAELLGRLREVVTEHPGSWRVVNLTTVRLVFIPTEWESWLPPIGSQPRFDPRHWVVLKFEIGKRKAFFGVTVWPTQDDALRAATIERLTRDEKEFGLRVFRKQTSDRFSQLCREVLSIWKDQDGPDEDSVVEAAEKKLDEVAKRLQGVRQALIPLFGH